MFSRDPIHACTVLHITYRLGLEDGIGEGDRKTHQLSAPQVKWPAGAGTDVNKVLIIFIPILRFLVSNSFLSLYSVSR